MTTETATTDAPNRRAPLAWGVTLGAFCALIVAMWPSIEDSIGAAVENY